MTTSDQPKTCPTCGQPTPDEGSPSTSEQFGQWLTANLDGAAMALNTDSEGANRD